MICKLCKSNIKKETTYFSNMTTNRFDSRYGAIMINGVSLLTMQLINNGMNTARIIEKII